MTMQDLGDAPPLGALYTLADGRRVALYHAESGSPAVVIETGAGSYGLDSLGILERCAPRTTTVVYDRAGSGWSDPGPGPRGAREVAADLHEVLALAGIDPPYLLVGHSLGGLLIRAFAQLHPDEVVGLVLVDPLVEGIPVPDDVDEQIVQGMLAEMERNPVILKEWYPGLYASWETLPPAVRDPLIARHADPRFAIAGVRDMQMAGRVLQDVLNGPPLPNIPVTVLTATQLDPSPGGSDDEKIAFNETKIAAHKAFAASVPGAVHRIFPDAGHFISAERPDLVAAAVFEMLDVIEER